MLLGMLLMWTLSAISSVTVLTMAFAGYHSPASSRPELANIGQLFSTEDYPADALREAKQGKKQSPEAIQKHADAVRGSKRSEATRARMRATQQAKAADLAHLNAGAIEAEIILHPLLDRAVVLAVLHVDEIDHDETG